MVLCLMLTLLLSFGIQPIGIRVNNTFIFTRLDVLFHSEKRIKTHFKTRQRLASEEGNGNKVNSHLFTSSAFVLRPFAGSPLHFNHNFSSSFFNSEGFGHKVKHEEYLFFDKRSAQCC